jgi:hypothetical protein
MMIKKREDSDEMLVNYSLSDTIFAKAKVRTVVVKLQTRDDGDAGRH